MLSSFFYFNYSATAEFDHQAERSLHGIPLPCLTSRGSRYGNQGENVDQERLKICVSSQNNGKHQDQMA